MNVFVPKEIAPGERRVALTPDVAGRIVRAGNRVGIERDAGSAAGFADADYQAAGATIVGSAPEGYRGAALAIKVQRPLDDGPDELSLLSPGCALIAFLQPLTSPAYVAKLAERKITALAMELIPRISRAQSMDALSSQATVAGYKAVLLAADALPKFFPMLMTAAGTVPPAKVLVLGAGVAGLQAIATARRLGAVVTGFDVRAAVKEQVESLGATFLGSPPADAEGAGGYAKELAADQQRRDQELIASAAANADVIITTALIPGRPAPLLITTAAVQNMKPGSAIVDLAAEAGGNCELSEPGQTVVKHAVTIMAPLNLASSMPQHASMLYAKNVLALFSNIVKDGTLTLDMNDEIAKGVCVTRDGQIVNEMVVARLQGVKA